MKKQRKDWNMKCRKRKRKGGEKENRITAGGSRQKRSGKE